MYNHIWKKIYLECQIAWIKKNVLFESYFAKVSEYSCNSLYLKEPDMTENRVLLPDIAENRVLLPDMGRSCPVFSF